MDRVLARDSRRFGLRPRSVAGPQLPSGTATVVASARGRADQLAVELSERPLSVLGAVLALNLGLAACFVGAGRLVGDQALFFREGAPGTVLSFGELLLIAAVAAAIHHRADPERAWWRSLWGLAAAVFVVFAFDEITQSLIYASHALEAAFDLGPAGAFHDLEAVLLTLLFVASALVLLPRAGALLRHPRALPAFAGALVLGAASQTLDNFAPVTRWEFVAEETLKLGAEALFLGGFLLVLSAVRKGA
jgi:hypothetical protein